ncbi:MAG: hypothetical protein JXR42_04895 [Gammaproteobacteria bacterium]|nr:hypothetical protein [Gammaproteobacteria bacterium]
MRDSRYLIDVDILTIAVQLMEFQYKEYAEIKDDLINIAKAALKLAFDVPIHDKIIGLLLLKKAFAVAEPSFNKGSRVDFMRSFAKVFSADQEKLSSDVIMAGYIFELANSKNFLLVKDLQKDLRERIASKGEPKGAAEISEYSRPEAPKIGRFSTSLEKLPNKKKLSDDDFYRLLYTALYGEYQSDTKLQCINRIKGEVRSSRDIVIRYISFVIRVAMCDTDGNARENARLLLTFLSSPDLNLAEQIKSDFVIEILGISGANVGWVLDLLPIVRLPNESLLSLANSFLRVIPQVAPLDSDAFLKLTHFAVDLINNEDEELRNKGVQIIESLFVRGYGFEEVSRLFEFGEYRINLASLTVAGMLAKFSIFIAPDPNEAFKMTAKYLTILLSADKVFRIDKNIEGSIQQSACILENLARTQVIDGEVIANFLTAISRGSQDELAAGIAGNISEITGITIDSISGAESDGGDLPGFSSDLSGLYDTSSASGRASEAVPAMFSVISSQSGNRMDSGVSDVVSGASP